MVMAAVLNHDMMQDGIHVSPGHGEKQENQWAMRT
jgi:hypothetical protein